MGIVNITLLSMFVASLTASCSQMNVFCVHLYSVAVTYCCFQCEHVIFQLKFTEEQ